MTSQRTFPPPIQGHSSDDESSISSFEDPSDGKPKNDPFPFEYGTSPPPLRNLPKDSFTDGFSPATTDFASDAKKVDFLSTPQFETPPDGNTVPRPVEKDAFDAMSASKTNDKEKEKHSASTIGAQDSPHVVGSRNRFFTRDASPLNATHPRNHSFSWNPKSTNGGVHRTDTPLHVTENCSPPDDNPKSYRDDGDSDTLPPQPSGSFTPTTHIGRTALYHDRSSPAVPVSATNVAPSPLAPSPSGSLDPSSKELSDTAVDQLRAQEVYINGLQTHKTLITQWKHLLQQVQSVELNEKLKIIQKQKEMIRDEEKLLETKRREFDLLFAALNRRESDLSRENEKIFQKLHEPSVKEQEAKLEERSKIIEERMDEMQRLYDMIEERRSRLRQKETELDYRERQVSFREADLNRKHREMESNLRERQVAVDRREHQATTWMRSLDLRERDVQKREDQVKQQLVEISQREVKLKTKNVSALEKAQETYSSWAQLALNHPDIEVLDKDSMSDDSDSDSESVESEERLASTGDEDPNTDKDDDNDGSGDDADPSTDIKIMTSLDEPTPPVSFNVVI